MTTMVAPPSADGTRAGGPAVDRASVRAFTDQFIAPYADGWEREGRVPEEFLERLGPLGLWAPFLPRHLGGQGLDLVTLGEVHEEVGRGCSSVRSLLTVHTMLTWALLRWGSPEQVARWAPALADGTVRGAFCLSEPGAGSDTAGITTTAVPHRGGWLLDGRKKWTTGGQIAGLFLVFAHTGTSIVALLVPRDTPGVRVTPLAEIFGTRASLLAEIHFDHVELGPDALLGPSSFASGMVLSGTLDLGRYSVACGSVGIVQACLDACADYADRRTVGGTALRELPLIRAKLSDMVTDARAARLLCRQAGETKDAGDPSTIMATWIAKYFASTAAARHATEAVQVHGANGMTPDYPVARLMRDAKVTEIIEGSTEIQRLTIADEAFRDRTPATGGTL
ncbi:acyl-CoA dehydrogenase family protein [Streptomyces sp. NPDC006997]|uniref:acyl-CoA dehydrogenase family protein n=1 Tax=Streptomyces sp. NPDC006997 TaxID=3155356 RepID=UPI0034073549